MQEETRVPNTSPNDFFFSRSSRLAYSCISKKDDKRFSFFFLPRPAEHTRGSLYKLLVPLMCRRRHLCVCVLPYGFVCASLLLLHDRTASDKNMASEGAIVPRIFASSIAYPTQNSIYLISHHSAGWWAQISRGKTFYNNIIINQMMISLGYTLYWWRGTHQFCLIICPDWVPTAIYYKGGAQPAWLIKNIWITRALESTRDEYREKTWFNFTVQPLSPYFFAHLTFLLFTDWWQ